MSEGKGKGQKILIIDDDEEFFLQHKAHLEQEGYAVLHADTGKQGEQIIDEEKPALVVTELLLEQGDTGFCLCYSVKKKHPQLPIIMVTRAATETGIEFDASTKEERSWIKADVVLDKPIRAEQLEREISRFLGAE